jgi:hypothetical protein
LLEPHHPKAGAGRRPMEMERRVRLYFLATNPLWPVDIALAQV